MHDFTCRQASVCVVLLMILSAIAGCATYGAGSQDARQIQSLLVQWKDAYHAQDLAAMMRLYADDYACKGKDKAGIEKAFAEYWRENAHYEVKVNIDDATMTIQGGHATVMPIALAGTAGSDSARLDFTRQQGQWRITGTEF